MVKRSLWRAAPLPLVLAAYAVVSTSALVGQFLVPTEEEVIPAMEAADEADTSDQDESTDMPAEDGGEEEGVSGTRRGDRPVRIRMEERNELKEQNRQQEEVGELIEQQIERALDAGEDVPDFEVMKERAKEQLFQASESHGEQGGASAGEEHRVCFRTDGSVTDNREECDADQSSHFGLQTGSQQMPGGEPGFAPVSDEHMQEQLQERFGQTEFVSADLTGVVSEALERLSAMMGHMQNNPAAMSKIQEAMTYLSGVLRQQSTGQTPSEDTRDQIRMRLESIMQAVSSGGGGSGGQGPTGFGPPDMSKVLSMMETMIPKLPQVIAIFEEEGIPVDPDARAAANEAVEAFARLKGPCSGGDMESCMELGSVMSTIDQRMRPPMEAAMEAAGKYEVGMRIHQLMSEGMEGMDMDTMGPPPGMNDGYNHGSMPPYPMPSDMHEGYDPSRMEQGGYQYPMPPDAVPHDDIEQDGGSPSEYEVHPE